MPTSQAATPQHHYFYPTHMAPIGVKVLEVCGVAPSPNSPESPTHLCLPLTFFDALWLKFPPNQRLFLYEASLPTPTLSSIIVPKLKHSLSLTLPHFLPLAGNLIWPPKSDHPIIHYSEGDSLSFTVAESEADFYRLSGDDFREAEELHPFLPNLPSSDEQVPAMSLQITLFPNKGFSIGYAAHHAVVDGKTTAMFFRSWVSICAGGSLELDPVMDRTLISDPFDLRRIYLNCWLDKNGANNKSLVLWDLKTPPDTVLGTFRLTPANIETIKNSIQAQWKDKNPDKEAIRPSTFTATSAYIWVCLVKARTAKTERVKLGINVDCRARLDPPLPPSYFGNCVAGRVVHAKSKELAGEDGVAMAAMRITEALARLSDGVLEGAEDWAAILLNVQADIEIFSIAGSPRFELYKTDFGWGRPRKVEMVSNDKSGAFYLSDSRDGPGAIEVGVVLKKHEIDTFNFVFSSGLGA
ncbi:Isoflavone-7-O-beta-glucoside 6''-O-malonyltransferase [Bertholletia excelsa]